jgi:MoaA/NifB/PqqE/SkfB family radical SAM enzyme
MISNAGDARLSIEVTTRCNSSCIHCFAGGGQNKQTEMEFNDLTRIVQEGTTVGYHHLHITGGEPLLYRDIFKALDCALDRGYESILLNTNGLLLDRQTCQKLAKRAGLTLSISLEGSELLHNRFRGPASYRKVVRGLNIALAAELDVIVFTIACKSVLPDLPRFADNLFYGFPKIKYLALNRLRKPAFGNALIEKEYLSPNDYLGLIRTVSLLNLINRPTVLLDDPLSNVVNRIMKIPWIPESKPLQRYGNLMIMVDHSLSLSHTSHTYFGRYRSRSIKRIHSSDRYIKAFSTICQVCHTCRHVRLCQDSGLILPVDTHLTGQKDTHFCKAVLNLASTSFF